MIDEAAFLASWPFGVAPLNGPCPQLREDAPYCFEVFAARTRCRRPSSQGADLFFDRSNMLDLVSWLHCHHLPNSDSNSATKSAKDGPPRRICARTSSSSNSTGCNFAISVPTTF